MKKVIYVLIKLLLIGTMLVSSYFLFKNIYEDTKQEKILKELQCIAQNQEEFCKNSQKESDVDIKELYKINNDLIGWLKIENTGLNYPVMQSSEKNYYLRKDFYKNYSKWGTPFLAENCEINISDNIIIYGHNLNNQKMFGLLEKYKKQDFWNRNKMITFFTLTENKEDMIKSEYQIFAVIKTTVYDVNSFEFYHFTEFSNEEEFETFIKKVKELSIYETGIIPKYQENIITLSTCEYSQKDGRLVVLAVKI